jgi:hypothetical protein
LRGGVPGVYVVHPQEAAAPTRCDAFLQVTSSVGHRVRLVCWRPHVVGAQGLYVEVTRGPSSIIELTEMEGNYRCLAYKPQGPGVYVIEIRWKGQLLGSAPLIVPS